MGLFWRVFAINAAVFAAGAMVLAFSPATISSPVLFPEAVVLFAGLAVMLVANALLLRVGMAPLVRLASRMQTIDLLRPGQRLKPSGDDEISQVIHTFNEMLGRLEQERGTSTARTLRAQEAERQRIARDLHDEVGQRLMAVLLDLKRVTDQASPDMIDELDHVREAVRGTLEEVRLVARRLRPVVLEDLGVTSALMALIEEFANTELTIRPRLASELPQLSEEAELVLYRVAQESLTNVARHASASHVELALRRTRGGVALSVVDDGCGFDSRIEGAGIRGMRERAVLVGADLDIDSRIGAGTRIHLELPAPQGR